jgi:hypothetical protein
MMETATEMWTIVIIGLVTVFISLIALVLMISIFKVLFAGKTAKQDKKPETPVNATHGVDPAIVAAIIAAIAMASGVSASSIRIASIEHSGFNTPVWGYVGRVSQGSTFGRA